MATESSTVGVTATRNVTEVDHPLVRHKLGLLRDVETDTEMFRQLVNELTLLLTYEATKTLADEQVEIETPLEHTTATRISGKKVAICPILRAGVGMLDAVLSLLPGARVGFIGMLILTFIGLIFLVTPWIAPFSVALATVFYLFEVVIVVSIQAYIFAALSAIYIGSAIEPEH